MGSITQALAKAAQAAGATIRTGAAVDHILIENDAAVGVVLSTGEEVHAPRVVSNARQSLAGSAFPGGAWEPESGYDYPDEC